MEAVAERPHSPEDEWRGWPLEQKRRLLKRLREQVHGSWRDRAHPGQLPPASWLGEDDGAPPTLFLSGGRGSGKTWAGAHIFREMIEGDPLREVEGPGEWAVVAPTFGDARDKCIESSESGLLLAFDTTAAEVEAGISPTVSRWNRSIGELYLHDGTFVQIDGADDGAYRIQGLNLRGCWCDEVGLWKKWATSWDESIGYALRKGQARRVATGTPKRDQPARRLVRRLLSDERVISRRLRTADNWQNLAPAFRERVAPYMGTELGRQELEGLLLEEAEGALWARSWIDGSRVQALPRGYLYTTVLGLDPADGLEDGDEQAWCLAGIAAENHHIYVIESEGMRETPFEWLKAAVLRARDASASIVVEKNHGAAFLVELLEQVMKEIDVRVPYRTVDASKGKTTRAEPVAMLYEQGATSGEPVIHHVGDHPDLEDQMCNFTGAKGEASPDRLDAMVWGVRHLMGYARVGTEGKHDFAVPYTDAVVPGGAVPWQ